jgi:hypothetical protein
MDGDTGMGIKVGTYDSDSQEKRIKAVHIPISQQIKKVQKGGVPSQS